MFEATTAEDAEALPLVLGWANPETAGGADLRLYALDAGPSPRWTPNGGRTVERALRESGAREGDRFILVRVSSRPS